MVKPLTTIKFYNNKMAMNSPLNYPTLAPLKTDLYWLALGSTVHEYDMKPTRINSKNI